jgi:protein-disulfide isomerase
MRISRRPLLALLAASPLLARPALAQLADPRMAPRSFGRPDAPVKVMEFFSLTCTHCAAFSRGTMPQVTTELIDTGKLQMIYRDFPLDHVALTAAMVARALPPERYEPFISALFASQDRWAFARGANTTEELAKLAALAGMSRPTFDATIADKGLEQAIMAEEQRAEEEFHIDSTPTFLCNGHAHAGEMSYAAFRRFITDATS